MKKADVYQHFNQFLSSHPADIKEWKLRVRNEKVS